MSPFPFLLIFREASLEAYDLLSPDERQRLLEKWIVWYERLAETGKVQHGHPLETHGRMISRREGITAVQPISADGRDAIAGYFLLTVASLDEATNIAKGCPTLQYGMTVEVRAISTCCHLARTLPADTLATFSRN